MRIRDKKNQMLLWFIVLSLIFGMMFSFLIVPWQSADEYTHLSLIGLGIKNNELADAMYEDLHLDADRITFHSEEKVNVEQLKSAFFKQPGYEKTVCLPKGINLTVLCYLPATIGLEIGVVLGLPTYWTLQCSELFALIFYVLIGCITLKLAPSSIKKIFFLIMLMPMCIQQAASINYDAVLLPLCFLFVSLIWHLKAEKKDIGWKEIIICAVILAIVTLIKPPYIMMGLLVFIVPLDRICLQFGRKKIRLKKNIRTVTSIVILLMILAGIALYVMRYSDSVQILFTCAQNLKQTAIVLVTTISEKATHLLISFVGCFGWLDSSLPGWAVYSYLLLIIIISMTKVKKKNTLGTESDLKLNISDKIIVMLFAVLLSILIALAMINHTVSLHGYSKDYTEVLYKISVIEGLQGRYFIPLAVPVLSILPGIFETDEKKMNILLVSISSMMLIISCFVIYHRYFG